MKPFHHSQLKQLIVKHNDLLLFTSTIQEIQFIFHLNATIVAENNFDATDDRQALHY